jgi:hypothetical protein
MKAMGENVVKKDHDMRNLFQKWNNRLLLAAVEHI